MGRRALRQIDTALDLSRHFLSLDDMDPKLDLFELFGRDAPLEVEMGSGKGLFIHDASGARPDHNFLGIEIAAKYARFAAANLAKSERDNAIMIHGDGLKLFREMVLDQSCHAVHVYFPDPWWKKRHRRRRVMTANFIADVERVLRGDGTLHFWTDVEEYFVTTLELISQSSTLAGPFEVPESAPTHDMDYRTHFERRMRQHDESVFRAEFRRK